MQQWLVKDLMRRNVYKAEPSMSVAQLVRALVERRITGAPVVDDEGELVGVVSLVDIAVRAMYPNGDPPLSGEALVETVMTRKVLEVPQDMPVREAVDLFRNHRVHRLVVTSEGQVVGTLGPVDLLDMVVQQSRTMVRP
ncbi:MAG: CBS domain-containing protein [Candidatus Eremiobacterota bacterium]